MRVIVLGVTGMLGNAIFRVLSENPDLCVYGTARGEQSRRHFSGSLHSRIIVGIDLENQDAMIKAFSSVKPNVVVNCVGLVKQLADVNDPLSAIPINALLPHRLAAMCKAVSARLIHFSTDCVFSGSKGDYSETDFPDATDLYGRSKLLGEVNYPHAITLRTSIIGHELFGHRSLVNWFLAQQDPVKGFTRAIFSGLPTVELAKVVRDLVLPNKKLHGLYHVASKPINKHDLLKLVAKVYGKDIEIIPSDELVINRSLNADRFNQSTGYQPQEWTDLIRNMHQFN